MSLAERISLPLTAALALLLSACAVEMVAPPQRVYIAPPRVVYSAPPVVSVYVEPPLVQPEPIAVAWAPPPMLVEAPPPPPFADAIWTGGYWAWQGNWVWAAGRWAAPPQPGYRWVQPYYEHRDNAVIFIGGHWGASGVAFVPPPPMLNVSLVVVAAGAADGGLPDRQHRRRLDLRQERLARHGVPYVLKEGIKDPNW